MGKIKQANKQIKTNKKPTSKKNQPKSNKQLPSVLWLDSVLSTVTQADFYRTLPLIIVQATYIQYAKSSSLQVSTSVIRNLKSGLKNS